MSTMPGPARIDLDALKRGDRDAFTQLVEAHSDQVYGLALRMTHNPQEAEDILQETFLKAYRALGQFEARSSIGTWLYRIAMNESLMRLRKRKPLTVSVEAGPHTDDGDQLRRQLEDWCCLPEDEFMSTEARRKLRKAVDTLSPALRAAFVLRDDQGLSTREAAEVLDISESAIKTRLFRARMQLREELSSYFSERLRERESAKDAQT
jgi:RNA polymerase sigma-70 factor (ECF subfamily)